MYTVEFEANVNDGVVYIPKNINNVKKTYKAKFIMIYDASSKIKTKTDSVDMIFDKYQIDMSHFNFDREEANER